MQDSSSKIHLGKSALWHTYLSQNNRSKQTLFVSCHYLPYLHHIPSVTLGNYNSPSFPQQPSTHGVKLQTTNRIQAGTAQ